MLALGWTFKLFLRSGFRGSFCNHVKQIKQLLTGVNHSEVCSDGLWVHSFGFNKCSDRGLTY